MLLSGCQPDNQSKCELTPSSEPTLSVTVEEEVNPNDPGETKVDGEQSALSRTEPSDSIEYGDRFPEVLAVQATGGKNGKWRFNTTLSSTYDSPKRYADAWRVLDEEGNQLGIRVLGHDHANEQPFTRSGMIEVPIGTEKVYVEGRDQVNGWSGQRFEFKMP